MNQEAASAIQFLQSKDFAAFEEDCSDGLCEDLDGKNGYKLALICLIYVLYRYWIQARPRVANVWRLYDSELYLSSLCWSPWRKV